MYLISTPMRANANPINTNVFAEKLSKLLVITRIGKRGGKLSLQFHLHLVIRQTRVLQPGVAHQDQKLFQSQSAVMRWIEEFFKPIVGVNLLRRRAAVGDQNPASGTADSRHFGQNNIGIQEMMESVTAYHKGEVVIRKWERFNIALPPREVR